MKEKRFVTIKLVINSFNNILLYGYMNINLEKLPFYLFHEIKLSKEKSSSTKIPI